MPVGIIYLKITSDSTWYKYQEITQEITLLPESPLTARSRVVIEGEDFTFFLETGRKALTCMSLWVPIERLNHVEQLALLHSFGNKF